MSRLYGPCLLFALWSCSTSKAVDGAAMIGPSGGTVSLAAGPSLQVPAGALTGEIRITISATGRLAPNGSPIFHFDPEGTTFARPVTVTFPLPPGATGASIYWSAYGSTSQFDQLSTAIGQSGATASVTHFSLGYLDAPCMSGAACTPANVCHAGRTSCSAAQPCVDSGNNLPDGTPCGTGLVCASGQCSGAATTRTVASGFKTSYWPDDGTLTTLPTTLDAGTKVALLVPDVTAAGYTSTPVTVAADGTFSVPSVPAGHYFLRTDTPVQTMVDPLDGGPFYTATIVNTDLVEFTTSAPPLTRLVAHRQNLAYATPDAGVTGVTSVTVNISNLDPWTNGDQIFLDGSQSDTEILTRLPRDAGPVTSATYQVNWLDSAPFDGLPDSSKNDVVWAVQRAQTIANPGTTSAATMRPSTKYAKLTNLTVSNGAPTTINIGLSPAPLNEAFPMNLKSTQFAALAPQVGPQATASDPGLFIGIYGIPHSSDYPAPESVPGRLTYFWVQHGSAPDTDYGSVSYGGFLPALWKEIVRVTFGYDVPYTPPGAAANTYYASLLYELPAATARASPVTPVFGPVKNLMINGTDAFTKQSGVGLQPVFSWSPPTLGAATGYQVYLYPASLVDQTVANGFTARVFGTSFRTPPGLLKSGISYLAVITSYQGRQFTLDQNPWVIGYPYYSADCVSAIFTP